MRRGERGSAVVVVMIVTSALMAGGALLTRMQTFSTTGAGLQRAAITGLYCAEAGLAATRELVIANAGMWDGSLGSASEPPFLDEVSRDLDGDGVADFTIHLRDNDDEASNDPTIDSDHQIFVVATCLLHPDTPTQVSELVTSTGQRTLWLRTQ